MGIELHNTTTPRPIITLTTDFGLSDGYVAAIKGVILSHAPAATIVDLCHAIAPQDIAEAAWVVRDTFNSFPPGTIHVIVVDPGVGSERAIVGLTSHGHYFLAPDNGVLDPLLELEAKARLAQRPDLYLSPLSHTFHGRDIFAPLAAHLANGNPLESIGPSIAVERLKRLTLTSPKIDPASRRISGSVIRIDHFGNVITNISAADVAQLATDTASIRLAVGGHTLDSWGAHYGHVEPGSPLILINSAGMVEIAVNQGNAADSLGVIIHTPILLSVCEKDNNSI